MEEVPIALISYSTLQVKLRPSPGPGRFLLTITALTGRREPAGAGSRLMRYSLVAAAVAAEFAVVVLVQIVGQIVGQVIIGILL